MKKLLAALAALSVVSAPVAHADPDGQYLSAVHAIGINADPAALIAAAHQYCDAMPFVNNAAFWASQSQFMAAGVPYSLTPQVQMDAGRAYGPDKLHAVGLS